MLWPLYNSDLAEVPDTGVTWPAPDRVSVLDRITKRPENETHAVTATRTATMFDAVNELLELLNICETAFVSMEGGIMTGDLDMGGNYLGQLEHSDHPLDLITKAELDEVNLGALDLGDTIAYTFKRNGDSSMTADLDMQDERIGDAITAPLGDGTSAVTKKHFDDRVQDIRVTLLPRTGTPVMTGDLNMDEGAGASPRYHGIGALPTPLADDEASTLAYASAKVATLVPTALPIGFMGAYAGDVSLLPPRWIACDGHELSRSGYSSLFSVCGTAWGAPTSGTVFRTPNMRGRTPVGVGDGSSNGGLNLALADTAGAEKILLNYHHIPAHAHDFDDNLNEVASGGNIAGATTADTSRGLAQDLRSVNAQGGDIAHDNVQPSIALGWYVIS